VFFFIGGACAGGTRRFLVNRHSAQIFGRFFGYFDEEYFSRKA